MRASTSTSSHPTDVSRLGPDPEPLGTERTERLMAASAGGLLRSVSGHSRHRPQPRRPPSARRVRDGCRGVGSRPIPVCVRREPALFTPYLTDGRELRRIVGRVSLGSEMIILIEDCRVLDVTLKTWSELAGRVRAVPTVARAVPA